MNPEKSSSEKFRKKLRLIRLDKELNQDNMADMVGMGYSRYAKVEEGITKVTLDMVDQFAEALKVDRGFLLDIGGSYYNSNSGSDYVNSNNYGPVINGSQDKVIIESLISKIEGYEKELREMKEEMAKPREKQSRDAS